MGQKRLAQVPLAKVDLLVISKSGNDELPLRAVEEEQGEVILLLLRDPRIDPNQQVLGKDFCINDQSH